MKTKQRKKERKKDRKKEERKIEKLRERKKETLIPSDPGQGKGLGIWRSAVRILGVLPSIIYKGDRNIS